MNISTTIGSKIEDIKTESDLERGDRRVLSEMIGEALANTYVLYHKTQAFHWNITGPLFYSVHQMTESQYKDMAEAIDDLAERIRSIGFRAPTGLNTYTEHSTVKDVNTNHGAEDMIRQLAEDHQTVAQTLRLAAEEADKRRDVYTADLLTARIGVHEEASWMLSALIA